MKSMNGLEKKMDEGRKEGTTSKKSIMGKDGRGLGVRMMGNGANVKRGRQHKKRGVARKYRRERFKND